MSDNTSIVLVIALIAASVASREYNEGRASTATGKASIKCPSTDRVVMSAPVNGVVSMVCRAQ